MAAGNISSEKIDLLIYGPVRPILETGFSDQFVLHKAESRADLERLTPDVLAKTRGMAVTYHSVPADGKALAHFPEARNRRQLWRRLRPRRFQIRARTHCCGYQHA